MPNTATIFMQRCFDLARRGAGFVSPNPMVGAVLVHNGRIIGEGWHERYGGPHAEVNCVASVKQEDRALIPQSTLYCSLEPCFHYGKTPPCVELVLREKIPHVVISNIDPNPKVAGQSVQKMREAGVQVDTGILEKEGRWLNRTFITWVTQNRPYVVLKWAQNSSGFISKSNERTAISGPLAQRLVHQWRSELDAILVGTNTAVIDNPRLDIRLAPGARQPLRLALDGQSRIPADHHLLDDSLPTLILGPTRSGNFENTQFVNLPHDTSFFAQLNTLLREKKCATLLIEGGAALLNSCISAGFYDEIRVLQSPGSFEHGVAAPAIPAGTTLQQSFMLGPDRVMIYT